MGQNELGTTTLLFLRIDVCGNYRCPRWLGTDMRKTISISWGQIILISPHLLTTVLTQAIHQRCAYCVGKLFPYMYYASMTPMFCCMISLDCWSDIVVTHTYKYLLNGVV